jgi:AcrR family transcriptional regulator
MPSDKTDKRAALIEAALELFAENGFHGAPTSMIAERAGVGVGTIYRYFKGKDELIRELFRELHTRAHELVSTDLPEDEPIRETLILVLTRILRFFLESPKEFKFMEQYYFSPYSTNDPECNRPEEDEIVKRLLSRGKRQGIFKDAPLPVLESIAFGPIVSLAKEHSNRNLPVDGVMIRAIVGACMDGLKR